MILRLHVSLDLIHIRRRTRSLGEEIDKSELLLLLLRCWMLASVQSRVRRYDLEGQVKREGERK